MTERNQPISDTAFQSNAFWRTFPSGMRKRWWLFRLPDLIAFHWPVFKARRGILVVRMDGIGDMVLFRCALDHYANAFGVDPTEIMVLGCDSWASVARELFAGYRVDSINEHAYAQRPMYRFFVNLRVRQWAPAVTVNDSYFRRALMADSLTWISRAQKTIAAVPYVSERTRSEFTYYMSQVSETIDTGLYPTHEIVRHFRFISAVAGHNTPPEVPRLTWRENTLPIDAGAAYVVLNPGSNEFGRRWPIAGYGNLAGEFLTQGLRVVVVGKAKEAGYEGAFTAQTGDPNFIDLSGKTDLPQLLGLLREAALVVSNDTGPAHVSIALSTPTVVIIGGGHFGCFVPYPVEITPANARFVYHVMECYHCFWRCHKRDDTRQSFPCVAAVTEDQVRTACNELLASDTAPSAVQ